jgi:hypothetical protein
MKTETRHLILILGCAGLSSYGCSPTKPETPPTPAVAAKYTCLSFPNSADQAGTVLRTVDADLAGKVGISADNLTRAFTAPATTGVLAGNFPDFTEKVSTGANGTLTANIFQKLGGALNVQASGTYDITMKAADNTQYTADDSQRLASLKSLETSGENRISGARYFFVKEAIGSTTLSYEAKTNIGVSGSVDLKAKDSSLSVDVTARNADTTVTSTKQLIACVVLEQFDFTELHAANGQVVLSVTSSSSVPKQDAQSVLQSVSTKR